MKKVFPKSHTDLNLDFVLDLDFIRASKSHLKSRWLLVTFFWCCAGGVTTAQSQIANSQNWEATLRSDLNRMANHLTSTLKPWKVPCRSYPVENYGAVPDGVTVNTKALQKAIDACSAAGGGTVLLAKGDYVSGTIELKTGVMFKIDKGARLLASTHLEDYPDKIPAHATIMDSHYQLKMSLIYAENCERLGICGDGEINGRGTVKNFPGSVSTGAMPGRPFLIRFVECRKVVMDGIHLLDSAAWMGNYLSCDDLILKESTSRIRPTPTMTALTLTAAATSSCATVS